MYSGFADRVAECHATFASHPGVHIVFCDERGITYAFGHCCCVEVTVTTKLSDAKYSFLYMLKSCRGHLGRQSEQSSTGLSICGSCRNG